MDLCGFTAAQVAAITGALRGTVLARVHREPRRGLPQEGAVGRRMGSAAVRAHAERLWRRRRSEMMSPVVWLPGR